MRIFPAAFILGALLGSVQFPVQLSAQQPTVLHAQFSATPAEGGLAATLAREYRSTAPVWLGYSIPVEREFHTGSNTDRVTYLEGHDNSTRYGDDKDTTYDRVDILLRVADGHVDKLHLANPDQQLDAGGLRFVWLTDGTPADSIRVFEGLARAEGEKHLRDEAVFYISLHRAPEATPALARLAAAGGDLGLREKAAFWLANQRGHEGFLAIQKLAREDADPQFREKLTFDLTLCHQPEAIDELIRMAKSDSSAKVRRQAQFWMANLGGKKVTADLREAAEKDPDEAVRKSAVFALSRLPGDEAATQLIQIAKTSHDPVVRKQAVFWLGQSSDPRATDYLEELLKQ